MVAKINVSKSLEATLNYNEKKVQKGDAVCLHAVNYLSEARDMNFNQKINAFERLHDLNERATTKTIHISLNFDPSEKLPNNRLIKIASVYMDKIGFGSQPFLIYRHNDAGHPHIHIVSTTIKVNGTRINTHNIGRNQSEKARKEIEQFYGLVRAERQQKLSDVKIKPLDIEKALYGKQETKKSISNIVIAVFTQYKFASIPEYNAALKQFNIVADRGKEDGRIFKHRGLVYRILDAQGNKVGVPIKASSLSCKPILENLENKFLINEKLKEPLKERLKNALDTCLASSPKSMKDLVIKLDRYKIYTVLRQNEEGRLYGIAFVDNQNKCVFNGSGIGKGYSAAALQNRLTSSANENLIKHDEKDPASSAGNLQKEVGVQKQQETVLSASDRNENLFDVLLSTKEQYGNTPFQLLKRKKKKRKKTRDS
jgi:hypothetical protein